VIKRLKKQQTAWSGKMNFRPGCFFSFDAGKLCAVRAGYRLVAADNEKLAK